MRFVAIFISLSCLASHAFAEESAADLIARMQTEASPWHDCAPGSWIQARSGTKSDTSEITSEFRQTLVRRDETGATVETRQVQRRTDANGQESIELGEPFVSTLPGAAASRYEGLKDDRHEDLVVDGKTRACRVITGTWIYSMGQPGNPGPEYRATMTFWFAPGISARSGLVKSHGEPVKNVGIATSTTDSILLETGKEMTIGNRVVTCTIFRDVTTSLDGKTTTTTETWTSPDIPAGYARTKMELTFVFGAEMSKTQVTTEVTAMEIVPGKHD